MELNYIFVLLSVAILWRPNENAKQYAYVMELPAQNTADDGDHGVEMLGIVPSAADEDDDEIQFGEKSNGGGFKDDHDLK